MTPAERLFMAVARSLPPETAHGLALRGLRSGAAPLPGAVTSPVLQTQIAGLTLPNPVGLAAGFDKNAVAVNELARAGFGFLEVGAATPRPQPGNATPRLFRLRRDRAVINRFGFNNEGVHAIAARLAEYRGAVPLGLNLGANKDSADRAGDFAEVLRVAGPHLSFATINVSSPNTEKLRDLQGADALRGLIEGVLAVRDDLPRRVAVFLKIAPDLSDAEIAAIGGIAVDMGLDAVIATNTTLARDGLVSRHRAEAGGLSGRPLMVPSTRVLARLSMETGGALPLIGVGGIETARHAFEKIRAGASAVQLYSALTWRGLSLVPQIARGLDELLRHHGFSTVAEAVGTGRDEWL